MAQPGITLTGADERTPIAELVRLADFGAEIGLLYTFAPEGRNRYPRLPWIVDAASALSGRAALHVCGNRARAALLRGNLAWLTDSVARVQVNGRVDPKELWSLCEGLAGKTVITQHTDYNCRLADLSLPNHALLVDASGGRGIAPESWTRPQTEKSVGFAGGLGPSTLRKELPRIAAVASGSWWIDMEARLRDHGDWFDANRATQALNVWRTFATSTQVSADRVRSI